MLPGPGLEGAAKGMESLGFVPGRRNAWMAGVTEVGGGLLLTLGLATPAVAASVFAVMGGGRILNRSGRYAER